VAVAAGHEVLARCDLVRITDAILNHAGALSPIELPSLDAIHIATDLGVRIASPS
jgi:hypothetical protein